MVYYTVIRGTAENHVQIGDKRSHQLVAEVLRDNKNRESNSKHYFVMKHDDEKGTHEVVR